MDNQGLVDLPKAPADRLAEAERELASTEARLCRLLDRATALASLAEREGGQLQRLLEEFALEQAIYDLPPSGGTGPLIAVQALRQGAQELTEELNRSSAMRGNPETAVRVGRACKEQWGPDRAFQRPAGIDDIVVQHAMNAAGEDERRRLAREVHSRTSGSTPARTRDESPSVPPTERGWSCASATEARASAPPHWSPGRAPAPACRGYGSAPS